MDARKAALEEAASVLRAVSSGGGGVDGSRVDHGGRDDESDASPTTKLVEQQQQHDATATAAAAATAASEKSIPKSRSDAVAAAKRRAEERKRMSTKHHGDHRKPPAASAATNIQSATLQQQQSTTTNVRQHQQQAKNISSTNQMDWFNLLSVVTNPASGGGHFDYAGFYHNDGASGASPTPSTHQRSSSSSGQQQYSLHNIRTFSRHHHGGLSSHGTPISLDHVGSDGTRGVSSDNASSAAASLLSAAGLADINAATAMLDGANASLASVASTLDEFTGWFDHYSRKYLGTVAGIDATGDGDDGDINAGGSSLMAGMNYLPGGIVGATRGVGGGYAHPSMLLEYTPEFGPDDVPQSQLEELPAELSTLNLDSVEGYLKECGMLGMRFEDRGGGFWNVRERIGDDGGRKSGSRGVIMDGKKKMAGRNEGGEDNMEEEKKSDGNGEITTTTNTTTTTTMASVMETVPEIFFSQYFDLTDPANFEELLLIGDDEVAQLREKEAQLHALADRKVKEAEEVAKQDAENENVAPRPPPRKKGDDTEDLGGGGASTELTSATEGTSLNNEARTTSTPTDDNVITLRKPETFTSHLDDIELVLLDQVRSKSERFFRETNRFSELQSLVTDSVDEVRDLRTELTSVRERCVTNVEIIPVMDDGRYDLRSISRVLLAVEDVVNCKASIASLMGAGDYLGAVEAIRLARELLKESPDEDGDDDDENDGDVDSPSTSQHSLSQHQQHHLSLGKLKALSKVSEQLNEYEKLVVQNLTDELVETFLSWGTTGGGGGEGSSIDYKSIPRITLSTERKMKIRGVVQSLRVCGKLSSAGVAYQRKLCELISVTVRAIVTECVADAAKTASATGDGSGGGSGGPTPTPTKGTMVGVASMSLDQFFDCINMLFEQVLGLLWGAVAVSKYCIDEGFILDDNVQKNVTTAETPSADGAQHTPSATAAALAAAADLSEKSVSELLRLRREAHSLVSFEGMRHLWDSCLTFTHQLEKFSGRKAYGLRSTLLAQAKSFVERKHEGNMSALVAALDSERWVQCTVSAERQAALTRLCSGRSAFSSRKATIGGTETVTSPPPATGREKMTDAEVEGVRYKVVWSCLLLLEMVMDDVACAAHFQTLATNVVGKVAELLRLFNTRSTHLVLGAGAIHSAARLKSINAKHLAIVTQCIALVLAILPHVRAALMAQLPARQHGLLYDLDKIKADYKEHSEKILSKLVSIIGGIVEHSLAPRIAGTDFDARARKASSSSSDDPDAPVDCCLFLDNVVTNTKKMHQVLHVMLPAELLRDVFSRIFAYLDHKVPSLFKAATTASEQKFSMPTTDDGKLQMIREMEYMAKILNSLSGVEPWGFTAPKVLEQELDIRRESDLIEETPPSASSPMPVEEAPVEEAGERTKPEDEPNAEKDMNAEDDPGSTTESVVPTAEEDNLNENEKSSEAVSGPTDAKVETAVDGDSSKNEGDTPNDVAASDENPPTMQDDEFVK